MTGISDFLYIGKLSGNFAWFKASQCVKIQIKEVNTIKQ